MSHETRGLSGVIIITPTIPTLFAIVYLATLARCKLISLVRPCVVSLNYTDHVCRGKVPKVSAIRKSWSAKKNATYVKLILDTMHSNK